MTETKFVRNKIRLKLQAWLGLVSLQLLGACMNTVAPDPSKLGTQAALLASPSPSRSTAATAVWKLSNPTLNADNTLINLSLRSDTSKGKFWDHCNKAASANTSAKPCSCQFSWVETNPSSATLPTNRTIMTTPNRIIDTEMTCPLPQAFTDEILSGTRVTVSIQLNATNPDQDLVQVTPTSLTKNANTETSAFADTLENRFTNILRYTCFKKEQKSLNIASAQLTRTREGATSGVSYFSATQFCIDNKAGQGSPAGCPNNQKGTSSQSNYFSLYIPAWDKGHINSSNVGYVCPQVAEPLSGGTSINSEYWPLDQTFALAMSPSAQFPIGVTGQNKLSAGRSVSSTCYSTNDGGGASDARERNTINQSCLGFAAPVNSDGSCPNARTAPSPTRMYRLRRYISLYPRSYGPDGRVSANYPQNLDTIYVLDRPVATSDGSVVTMAGPKPCPFAYFDRMNVTGLAQYGKAYVGTNNPRWRDKNVDGTEFPNIDGYDNWNNKSCSAALPKVLSDGTGLTLQTVNVNNTAPGSRAHAYIRPIQPFAPNYIEDTSFQACAPPSYPVSDPPLHFATLDPNKSEMGWCAEVYPTQNAYVSFIDPPHPIGSATPIGIAPFTSHVAKNAPINQRCTPTQLPNTLPQRYPVNGLAHHLSVPGSGWDGPDPSETCDRTVRTSASMSNTNVPAPTDFPWFPLLAPADDTERALTDPSTRDSYLCKITYDSRNRSSSFPSGGCCAAGSLNLPTPTASSGPAGAHLEPGTSCGSPGL